MVPNLSLCAGVTRLAPEQVDFEDFEEISDLAEPSWVLSGTEVFHSGVPLESDYPLDLDLVAMGSKVGVMVTSDGELHFFHDGRDMGCAAKDIPAGKNLCFCCHGKDIILPLLLLYTEAISQMRRLLHELQIQTFFSQWNLRNVICIH